MTENEALKLIKSLVIDPKCELVKTFDFKATVIKALEDLQQYRAIGTIEEFKALKEKSVAKKVIDIHKPDCSEDIEYFGSDELFGKCPHCGGMVNHTWNPCSCGDCAGLIDWIV